MNFDNCPRGPWFPMSNSAGTEWEVARRIHTGDDTTTLEWFLTDSRRRPARFSSEAEARAEIDVLNGSK